MILSYDDMDLDDFTRRLLVGRWFKSEEEAQAYLQQHAGEIPKGKTVNDYIVYKEPKDGSLKPWRIGQKPSVRDLNRSKAAEFIRTHAVLSSPFTAYVTHPLYAYVDYNHIDTLKSLGVAYTFKPIQQIPLTRVMVAYIQKALGGAFGLDQEGWLKYYNFYSDRLTMEDLKNFQSKIEAEIEKFNNMVGTDFYIVKIKPELSDRSMRDELLHALDQFKHPAVPEHKKLYKDCLFGIGRGPDEEEYLAVVPMESLTMPKMVD